MPTAASFSSLRQPTHGTCRRSSLRVEHVTDGDHIRVVRTQGCLLDEQCALQQRPAHRIMALRVQQTHTGTTKGQQTHTDIQVTRLSEDDQALTPPD